MPAPIRRALHGVVALSMALQTTTAPMAADYYRRVQGPSSASGATSPDTIPAPSGPSANTNSVPGTGNVSLSAARYARGRPGLPLKFPIMASDASGTLSWSVVSGTLPDGVTLYDTGVVFGTPSVVGTYDGIVVQAADPSGNVGQTQPFRLDVAPLPTVSANSATAASGGSISIAPSVRDAYGSQTWSVVGGSLPYGLSLDAPSGRISGASDQAGTTSGLRLVVTDADGAVGSSAAFSISVTSSMAVTGLNSAYGARSNVPFPGITPSVTGATGPVAWSLASGNLPGGMSVDPSTGSITGTPVAAVAAPNLRLRATANGVTVSSAPFSITVGTSPVPTLAKADYFARVGNGLTIQPSISGLVGQGRWFLDGGTAPGGLTFSQSSGAVSGTMAAAGTVSNLSIRVVDLYDGASGSTAPFSVTGLGKPAIGGVASASLVVDSPFSMVPSASNVSGTPAWTLSGTLPTGLAFDSKTGVISGTPTTVSPAVQLSLALIDGFDGTAAQPTVFSLSVQPKGTLVISGVASAYTAFAGRAFSLTPGLSGATGATTWTLSSYPSWVSLDSSTGALTGTPGAPEGSGTLQLTVGDSAGKSASSPTFTLDAVRALSFSYASSSTMAGQAFALVPSVSDASGTPTFAYTGNIPDGVAFNAGNGAISGTAFVPGSYPLTVSARDARATSDNVPLPLQVVASPWQASIPAQPSGKVGVAFSAVPSATGFTGAVSWTLATGTSGNAPLASPLPSWASLSGSTGTVSGTPPTTGYWGPYMLEASDASGHRARTNAFNLSVVQMPSLTATAPNGSGYINAAFRLAPTASNTQGGTTWSLTKGTLPAGLQIDPPSGVISGVPTAAANVSGLVLSVTDGTGTTADSAPFSISIATSPVVIGSIQDVSGYVGSTLATRAPTVSGTTGAYGFTLASGTLPAWATLDPATGIVSGTPTGPSGVGATTGLVLQVADASGYTQRSNPFAVRVARATLSAAAPAWTSHLNQALTGGAATVYNALGTVSWSVSPALPPGLSLDPATGAVSGTPGGPASSTPYTFTARDAFDNATAPVQAVVTVLSNPTVAVGAYQARQNHAFAVQPSAGSAIAPLTWALTAGTLPAGITLDTTTGRLSGTPTATGTASGLVLTVTDAQNTSGSSSAFSITVGNALALSYAKDGYGGRVGLGFASDAPTVLGAVGTPSFALGSGTLPAGLSVEPVTGRISGTPTAVATGPVTIAATDGSGETSYSGTLTMSVTPSPTVQVADTAIRVGAPLNLGVSIGNAVSRESVTPSISLSGSLPAGIAYDGIKHAFTGRPAAGTNAAYPVTVSVRDADGATGSTSFTLTVQPGLTVSNVLASYPGRSGKALSPEVRPTLGNVNGTVSWSASSLPAGLTLTGGTGAVTGTPASPSSSTITLTAEDGADGAQLSVPVAFAISPALQVFGATGFTTHAGFAASAPAPSIVGQRGSSVSWTSVGAPLPSWASLDGSTGIVSTASAGNVSVSGLKVRAIDGLDQATADSAEFGLTSVPAVYVSSVSTSYTARNGFAFTSGAPTLVNAIGDVRWTLGTGALPSWAHQNPDGSITGTPDAVTNTDNLSVVGTDAANGTATSVAFSLNTYVQPSVTLATNNATGKLRVGDAYTLTPSSQGISGTPTWSVAYADGSTALPTGIAMADASNGVVSGVVQAAGEATFSLKVVDSRDGANANSNPVKLSAKAPLAMSAIPDYRVRANRGFITTPTPAPTGLVSTASYSLDKAVPPGMNPFNATTGVLSGLPSQAYGPSTFTQTLTDAWDGRTASSTFTVTVIGDLAFSTQPTSVSTTTYTPVSMTPAVANASGTLSFALKQGTNDITSTFQTTCPGLAFSNATAAMTGSATGTCSLSNLTVVATDPDGATATSSAFTVAVTPSPVSAGVAKNAYSAVVGLRTTTDAITASGGTGSYTYTLQTVSGTAPMAANTGPISQTNGSFYFTPTVAGTWVYSIKVASASDATNFTQSPQVTVTSAAPSTSATPVTQTVVKGSLVSLKAISNIPSPTWALINAPDWLSINANGDISGITPDYSVNSGLSFQAKATSGSVSQASGNLTLNVNQGTVTFGAYSSSVLRAGQSITVSFNTTIPNPAFNAFSFYNGGAGSGTTASDTTVSISGNVATVTASSTAGAGNTARATYLSATSQNVPTGSNANKAVNAASAGGYSTYYALSMAGIPSNVTVSKGTSYTGTLTATGLYGTGTWTLSGTLPAGLTPTASGGTYTIAGTPTGTAGSTVTVSLKDSLDNTVASQTIVFTGTNSLTATAPASVSGIRQTALFNGLSPTVSGGTAPYTWALKTGGAPAGLTLDQTTGAYSGRIAGGTGTATMMLRVTDANGAQGDTANYTMGIVTNTIAISNPSPGQSLSFHVGATKTLQAVSTGAAKTSYYAQYNGSGVAWPAWLTVSPSGVLTANPTAANSSVSYSIFAVDGNDSAYASNTWSAKPIAAMAFSTQPASVAAITSSNYTGAAVAVSNSIGGVTYSLSDVESDITPYFSSLCPGLTFSTSTGAITGTPSSTCNQNPLTVTATDAWDGSTATSNPFSVKVTQSSISVTGLTPKVRSGATFTATASTSLTSPTWSSSSSPSNAGMDQSVTVTGTTLTGTAATVTSQTSFNITMTAKQATPSYTLVAPSVPTLIIPRLTAALPTVAGTAGGTYSATPTVNTSAAQVGTLSFTLTAGGVTGNNALSACGLSLDPSTGTLSSQGLRQCTVNGATIKVSDDGKGTGVLTDTATTTFNVAIAPGFAFGTQPATASTPPGSTTTTVATLTGTPSGTVSWSIAEVGGAASPSWITLDGCTNSQCTVTVAPPSGVTSGVYPSVSSYYRLTATDGLGSTVNSSGFQAFVAQNAQSLTPINGTILPINDFWVANSARRTGAPYNASWGKTAYLNSCNNGSSPVYAWDFGQPVVARAVALDLYVAGSGSVPISIRYSYDNVNWNTAASMSPSYSSGYSWIPAANTSQALNAKITARYWAVFYSGYCSSADLYLSSFRLSN